MSALTLKIDSKLLTQLKRQAEASGKTVEEFIAHTLEDAVHMWEDFYDLDDQLEQELEEDRPTSCYFTHA